jgi:hypothetical protein
MGELIVDGIARTVVALPPWPPLPAGSDVVGPKQTMFVTANSTGVTLVSLDVRFGSMISRQ